MSTNDGRPRNRSRSYIHGPFMALPHYYFRAPEFGSLSGRAVKLLIEIGLQYTGSNNGDLAATYSMMRPRGFKSADLLRKARNELINAGWIMVTRQGGKHAPSLYALTFQNIDQCKGKLDIAAGPARHLWKRENAHHRELVTVTSAPGEVTKRRPPVHRSADYRRPQQGPELDRSADQAIQN
jgi:hypothetical protein